MKWRANLMYWKNVVSCNLARWTSNGERKTKLAAFALFPLSYLYVYVGICTHTDITARKRAIDLSYMNSSRQSYEAYCMLNAHFFCRDCWYSNPSDITRCLRDASIIQNISLNSRFIYFHAVQKVQIIWLDCSNIENDLLFIYIYTGSHFIICFFIIYINSRKCLLRTVNFSRDGT